MEAVEGWRCLICGTPLRTYETGVCPLGCRLASSRTVTESWDAPRVGRRPDIPTELPADIHARLTSQGFQRCEPIGNRCSLCGGHFEEGDDVCSNRHFLGGYYQPLGR